MSTLGSTTKPTDTQEWSGANTNNQSAMDLTFPSGGPWKVTKIGIWVNGKDNAASFRGVIWSSTRNSILGQTAQFNANNEPFALSNSDLFEKSIITPFVVAGGTTVYAGWHCDPDESRQWGRKPTGSHYDDSETSEYAQSMSGEALDSNGDLGVYIIYELENQAPVTTSVKLEGAASGSILSGSDSLWLLAITATDDSAGALSKYDYQMDTTSGNSVTPDWASLPVNVANATAGISNKTVSAVITHALTRGQWYALRARVYDDDGLVSAWSPTYWFKVNALPTIVKNAPTAGTLVQIHNLSNLALWVGSEARPRMKFTPTEPDGQTITKYQLIIYDAASAGTAVYSSGQVTVSWASGTQQTIDVPFGIANGTERWWTINVYDGIEWAGESTRTAFKMRWAQGLYEFDAGTGSTNWSMITGTVVEQSALIFRGADTAGGDAATGKTAWVAAVGSVTAGKRYVQILVRLSTDTAGTSGTLGDMTFKYYGTPSTPDGWTVA